MQTDNSLNLHRLSLSEWRTYFYALLFTAGNILFPQICHLIPDGGHIFLPIYFFTLIGAFRYGWRVGLLTAVASPLVNSLLFGMPPVAALPAIMLKSVLLALFASLAAERSRSAGLITIGCVVISYQLVGMAGEWLLTGSAAAVLSDIRLGFPGLLIQIFGGWGLLRMMK